MSQMSPISQIVGYIAGLCTTFSAVPQIIKCYKAKSTQDLSYLTLGMVETGVISWTVYGVLNKDYPIILWNVVSVVINTMLLALKIKYDGWRDKQVCVVSMGGAEGNIEAQPLTNKI
jgi:MtN3 and saliva related transmembrane protein